MHTALQPGHEEGGELHGAAGRAVPRYVAAPSNLTAFKPADASYTRSPRGGIDLWFENLTKLAAGRAIGVFVEPLEPALAGGRSSCQPNTPSW
jgi:hypothetical protein